MKPNHVDIIVALADAGSLRAAADRIGKTQPALTKALRQAEDQLGARIFTRAARGVEPTEIGRAGDRAMPGSHGLPISSAPNGS